MCSHRRALTVLATPNQVTTAAKPSDCYLGLLYTMEDVSVYGYITPLKVKIVLTLALTDGVVKDIEVINVSDLYLRLAEPLDSNLTTLMQQIFKALHMAYYAAASNPFLKHNSSLDAANDASTLHLVGSMKWKGFRRRVDRIAELVCTVEPTAVN